MVKNQIIKCPYCRQKTDWEGNKWRPFCSERCKMIDLGKWASEDYKVLENSPDEPFDEVKNKDFE
ncbi:MAG: DNA gyrase inhibitor YacG [Thermodesulfobacteriota bacterium]